MELILEFLSVLILVVGVFAWEVSIAITLVEESLQLLVLFLALPDEFVFLVPYDLHPEVLLLFLLDLHVLVYLL